ncbi:MAG TPA: hypothetical protein VFE98_07800 [Candidatus Bathyarchaeia archaeon]|nr:hypothetical protein [Candidatus Bathyarchaeia archaeon]
MVPRTVHVTKLAIGDNNQALDKAWSVLVRASTRVDKVSSLSTGVDDNRPLR